MIPIADLHCDLLDYLVRGSGCTAYNREVRCSIPQLQEGGVKWQTLAMFTTTNPRSVEWVQKQFELSKGLKRHYPEFNEIDIALAFENASGFSLEGEALEDGLDRLAKMHSQSPIRYISLTWNDENRFGGGNKSAVGLKEDGERLLEFMHGKGIAVDFSHTSDALAYGILDHIDKRKLDVRVIASHSNFRKVCNVPRNLPDELALEIGKRDGIIGLNVIALFLGQDPVNSFRAHMEQGLKLGLENHLCFGADFFYEGSIPAKDRLPIEAYFFPEFSDASAYPKILQIYASLGLSQKTLQKIASSNFHRFLQEN